MIWISAGSARTLARCPAMGDEIKVLICCGALFVLVGFLIFAFAR
jgi:hypothetical protein